MLFVRLVLLGDDPNLKLRLDYIFIFIIYLPSTIMSSSQSQEDTYEAQNDQRLDELHSKIRTLRGVSYECIPPY